MEQIENEKGGDKIVLKLNKDSPDGKNNRKGNLCQENWAQLNEAATKGDNNTFEGDREGKQESICQQTQLGNLTRFNATYRQPSRRSHATICGAYSSLVLPNS
ncbi:unnamed protein product [Dovyalis caffra]|uniref:Uncharacterized protein n=1 Tax=Dovyalis caffra TaxID=77055 RepID=A0AAV1SCM9_9ROSI|nr:unnamed protein product [Dovyalis caffra]